jgi:hypothetical protein
MHFRRVIVHPITHPSAARAAGLRLLMDSRF